MFPGSYLLVRYGFVIVYEVLKIFGVEYHVRCGLKRHFL